MLILLVVYVLNEFTNKLKLYYVSTHPS